MGSITRLMEAPVTIVLGVLAKTPVWGGITAVPTATMALRVQPSSAKLLRRVISSLGKVAVTIRDARMRVTGFITRRTGVHRTVAPPSVARMHSRALTTTART